MSQRITLKDGSKHIVQSEGSVWRKLTGDWIDKDSPSIVKVETGKLVFVADKED